MLVPHIAGVSPVAFLSKAANAFASRWRCGSSIAARKAATLAVVRCVLFWRIESSLRSPRGRSSNDGRAARARTLPGDDSSRKFTKAPPSQVPQSARRKDHGDASECAERPECPHEEEAAGGRGDLGIVCAPHVNDE